MGRASKKFKKKRLKKQREAQGQTIVSKAKRAAAAAEVMVEGREAELHCRILNGGVRSPRIFEEKSKM
jgi:hypothetical protein